MAADKEIINKKHEQLRQRFKQLSAVCTKQGKKKYTYAHAIEILAAEFFYKEKTVEMILIEKG